MCGINGFITTEDKAFGLRRAKFMAQALTAGVLRGRDSTGAYFVPHNFKPNESAAGWCKQVTDGYSFVHDNKAFGEAIDDGLGYWGVVGHNRAATVGGVSVDAAHPFQEGPITLVHNGTLHMTDNLPISQHKAGAVNDSQTIAINLVDTPIWELSEELCGAFALVWHDARDNTMNVLRNDERPLHIAKARGEDTLYIASEAKMLHWLLARNKMTIDSMATPKPGQWLQWEEGNLVPTITDVKLDDWMGYNRYSSGSFGGFRSNYGRAPQVATMLPKHKERENEVFLGGRLRDVPMCSQESLLELGLTIESRMVMEPTAASRQAGTPAKNVVSGYAHGERFNCIIHGVLDSHCSPAMMQNMWVVRPVAVKMLDRETPAIVCRICTTDASTDTGRRMLEEADDVIPFEPLPTGRLVPGPEDTMISEDEYAERVGTGCVQCAGNIYLGDAEEIVWTSAGPLCSVCSFDTIYGERTYAS